MTTPQNRIIESSGPSLEIIAPEGTSAFGRIIDVDFTPEEINPLSTIVQSLINSNSRLDKSPEDLIGKNKKFAIACFLSVIILQQDPQLKTTFSNLDKNTQKNILAQISGEMLENIENGNLKNHITQCQKNYPEKKTLDIIIAYAHDLLVRQINKANAEINETLQGNREELKKVVQG